MKYIIIIVFTAFLLIGGGGSYLLADKFVQPVTSKRTSNFEAPDISFYMEFYQNENAKRNAAAVDVFELQFGDFEEYQSEVETASLFANDLFKWKEEPEVQTEEIPVSATSNGSTSLIEVVGSEGVVDSGITDRQNLVQPANEEVTVPSNVEESIKQLVYEALYSDRVGMSANAVNDLIVDANVNAIDLNSLFGVSLIGSDWARIVEEQVNAARALNLSTEDLAALLGISVPQATAEPIATPVPTVAPAEITFEGLFGF
jgi:hypothetical protein